MHIRIPVLLFTAACAAAAAPAFREEKLHGRHAYVLDNGLIRVSVLRGGGHIAEVRLLSSDPKKNINPMRVPHYPTIEPYEYQDAKHDAIYGTSPHRWLHSGYMGHLLCFPFYGPPSSEDEVRAGLGNHGEAPIVEWRKIQVDITGGATTLRYGATLEKTQYRVERAVTLADSSRAVRVEEWVENLVSYDRPVNWMQHATFGPPFIEPGRTFLDVSATRGLTAGGRPGATSLKPNSEVQWPRGTAPDGRPADLRPFQPVPNAGAYVALLLDRSRTEQFFTLYNAGYGVLIGYLFPAQGNPWLADWQENKSNRTPPWNGQALARGIEFGSTPFAEGLRKSIERGSLFDVPAYRWIGARRRLKTEFTIFVNEVPIGFGGVRDVRREGGVPVVVPR